MGYKETIIKAVKNNSLEFDGFVPFLRQDKVLNSQTVKFRFDVIPVFGEFKIDSQYSSNPQPNRVIDVEITVWGKVSITIQSKPSLRTKGFLKFVDLFYVGLTKLLNKSLESYKESLKPVSIPAPVLNQFGRPIKTLDHTATNKEIEILVIQGYEVQVKTPYATIFYGVCQQEVDLFYFKKSA